MKNCMESTDVQPVVASPTALTWQSPAAWKGLTGTCGQQRNLEMKVFLDSSAHHRTVVFWDILLKAPEENLPTDKNDLS